LLNVFGQRPGTSQASTAAGSVKVYAPGRVCNGLYYEARFTITARRELKNALLVLDSGWLEGTTVNTIEPSPGRRSQDVALYDGNTLLTSIDRTVTVFP
jgi:hypothetical protein